VIEDIQDNKRQREYSEEYERRVLKLKEEFTVPLHVLQKVYVYEGDLDV